MRKYAAFLVVIFLLLLPHPSHAETIYFRYFESIDVYLEDELFQILSFTALRGEKVTVVAYGMDSGALPTLSVLDPTGATVALDTTPLTDQIAYVQFFAPANGIYPIIVSRYTPAVGGLVRVMLFEGDPLDEEIALLDTVDPFQPSRAFLVAGKPVGTEVESLQVAVQSRPFANDPTLPLPQFFVSRANLQEIPSLEERLTPVERFGWTNAAGETFYTINIRPVPEVITPAMQQELVAVDAPEIRPLEQPLLPYDYVLAVGETPGEPVRLERPQCSTTVSLAERTLVVQDTPGEAYRPLGTLSGDVTLEIIGTDDTGEWIQIVIADSLSGSGWVQNRDFYDVNAATCQRVIAVEENTADLNEAITEVITKPIVAVVPTPTPTPFEPTPTPRPTVIPGSVELSMSVDNEFPYEGNTVRFTITMSNFGTLALNNMFINSGLTEGLTFVGLEDCPAANGSRCNVGTVAAGGIVAYIVVATVDGGTVGQTLTSRASTTIGTQNLSAEASLTVVAPPMPVEPPPEVFIDAGITKSINNANPAVGEAITYTITVTNPSSVEANITINDALPAGVSYNFHTLSQGTYTAADGNWQVGILAAGASATLQITATVTTTSTTTVTNTATITSSSPGDSNTANNSASASFTGTGCPLLTLNVAGGDTNGLKNAIILANQCPDTNTIVLSSSSYDVTAVDNTTGGANGFPVITAPLTINGNNAIINRNMAGNARFFYIASGVTVTFNSTQFSNGFIVADGGAIYNNGGTLNLNSTAFYNNVGNGFGGGAVFMPSGTINISLSIFSGNQASAGGAIYADSGTLNIHRSYFASNNAGGDGGAILTRAVTLIQNSTFNSNSAGTEGGAFVSTNNTTSLNSTYVNTTAGVATISEIGFGVVTLRNSIIRDSSVRHCNGDNIVADTTSITFGAGIVGTCPAIGSGDPLLGTLTGSPAYFPLQIGSAATGIGTTCPGIDQPGNARPGTGCDAGAHELP